MTEQSFTQSDPGDSPQSNVWSLRPRMVALIVVAALVAGTLVGGIATRLSRPGVAATPTDASPTPTFVTGLADGGTGRVGPWSLALSDVTVIGPADRPDRFVVTVVAKNVTKLPAYPENLRFFDAIRDDKGSSSGRDGVTRIDCAQKTAVRYPAPA
ncbi:hypothetical protein ACFYV7_22375 [Nocardia suismassiliense]|uniref:DUF4352 domain-containing protein n=1 Tax=Nocardia suismassiliense TaxID=2077092 RepID=A0ABW6QWD8_9NOCA